MKTTEQLLEEIVIYLKDKIQILKDLKVKEQIDQTTIIPASYKDFKVGEHLWTTNTKEYLTIIKDIIERKKENNRVFYKVLWKGFKIPSWETRVDLIKTNKDLIIEYEKKLKDQ